MKKFMNFFLLVFVLAWPGIALHLNGSDPMGLLQTHTLMIMIPPLLYWMFHSTGIENGIGTLWYLILGDRLKSHNMGTINRGMGVISGNVMTMAHIAFLFGVYSVASSGAGVDGFFAGVGTSLIAYYYAIVLQLTCTIRSSGASTGSVQSISKKRSRKRAA